MLQCVAMCCSLLRFQLHSVAAENCGGALRVDSSVLHSVVACCTVLCCNRLLRVAVCRSVLQCVAVCCSVLQCVAVCCSAYV